MGRIHRLSEQEARKIAAGEVVERPANVIKELCENARDAGATQITLHLEDGGKRLIRIVDNGHGMSPEDALLSIEHHATSKLTRVEDLQTLSTFGFRGEALASIAAVSTMTLITKEENAPWATMLELDEGRIITQKETAHNTGTHILIRDLFWNMPARKKFLKKRETEWHQIQTFLHACILSALDLHLTVTHDDTFSTTYPAVATVRDRCIQLWGSQVAAHLIDLDASHHDQSVRVNGIISNHQHARYDRSAIFCFVNGRWIKDTTITRALTMAYQNVLPPGRYPLAALFITIDPREVDINIHPRKQEVQFLHQRTVETLVKEAAQKALEKHLSQYLKKEVSFTTPSPTYTTIPTLERSFTAPSFQSHDSQTSASIPLTSPIALPPSTQPCVASLLPPTTPAPHHESQQTTLSENTPHIIGAYASTYILVEHADGLFLIDQHAAHERILYERFIQRFNDTASINLIMPHIITLTKHHLTLLLPYVDLLRGNGFGIAMLGDDQLIISATPVHAINLSLNDLIQQLISWIGEEKSANHHDVSNLIHHKLRAQMACKTAVKAGDELSVEMMTQLVADLWASPNKLTCPHGRPTGLLFPLYEIEKRFKRIG